jgi:SAM-dependent methyltransferase
MKNKDKWKASKYVYRNGRLASSKNLLEVKAGSRLVADLVAVLYDTYIPQYARGKLIDLGCGKVPLFEAYKNYVTDNICVDWENTAHKNEYLDFECDLTKKTPFQDDEFDTLILSDVLEHIPQPEKLWQEMFRIIAPRGKIILNVPFCYALHEEPHDYYRYTEHALRRFAEQSNFTVLLLKPIGGTPEILADILAKHLQFIPFIGRCLAITIQSVTYSFIKSSVGKRLSEQTGKKYPFGYFLVAEKN